MQFLPMVVQAEHRGGYSIRLVFNDGVEGTVDWVLRALLPGRRNGRVAQRC
jgi:hypothetical protein